MTQLYSFRSGRSHRHSDRREITTNQAKSGLNHQEPHGFLKNYERIAARDGYDGSDDVLQRQRLEISMTSTPSENEVPILFETVQASKNLVIKQGKRVL